MHYKYFQFTIYFFEHNIRELEDENTHLQEEYEKLKTGTTGKGSHNNNVSNTNGEVDMVSEARMLRQHKGRLEARMQILEDHNRQLEAQLQRLRQLLEEVRKKDKMFKGIGGNIVLNDNYIIW